MYGLSSFNKQRYSVLLCANPQIHMSSFGELQKGCRVQYTRYIIPACRVDSNVI